MRRRMRRRSRMCRTPRPAVNVAPTLEIVALTWMANNRNSPFCQRAFDYFEIDVDFIKLAGVTSSAGVPCYRVIE